MPSEVIVFDYGQPPARLLAWFLSESGINNYRVTTVEDVLNLLDGTHPSVVVVNSLLPPTEIAPVVNELREHPMPPRIVVVHDGRHTEGDPEVLADLCCHGIMDVDDLVSVVKAALEDHIPSDDPHEAAEQVAE